MCVGIAIAIVFRVSVCVCERNKQPTANGGSGTYLSPNNLAYGLQTECI
jgi:hypothetical protein